MFPGSDGGYLDASALRRRYIEARDDAKLRPLRFHDLRHVFGSHAINKASILQVQRWMGHADVKTTMRYLHHKSHASDADLLDEAGHSRASLGARADECSEFVTRMVERRVVFPATSAFRETDPVLEDHWE